jgi:GAF domain-containing protein
LLALCALGLLIVFFNAADIYGLGSRPWRGFWDATVVTTGQPYITTTQPRPDGATATAGIRASDAIDLREQSLEARYAWIYELMATQPTPLVVHRGNRRFIANVVGSTAFEGPWAVKLTALLTDQIAALFFLGCATLIALRQAGSSVARALAFVLVLQVGRLLGPKVMVPSATLSFVFLFINTGCVLASSWLLVNLASHFGARNAWRHPIELCAYALSALAFGINAAAFVGLWTLWFDPLSYFGPAINSTAWHSLLWSFEFLASLLAVVAAAGAAVASTDRSERTRAAWLLLPLPIAFALESIVSLSSLLNPSWFLFSGTLVGGSLVSLLGALAVTYALLRRRVLDFEFILGRTLVVATISLIVVVAFILLEWLLGTVLSNVSHLTGLVANAALALALGLSLRYIHRRVDTFVDAVLFRKRHEDERALLDFSKEAAFVTDLDVLVNATLGKLHSHTDARDAALLVDGDGSYSAIGSFGDIDLPGVSENDEAVLSLKAWHRPIDPHHYSTALQGALALPMLARGRLTAILLLGERAGGEAYAPDEIEALSQFAHGVGSSLDALREKRGDENADLRGLIVTMAADLRVLSEHLLPRSATVVQRPIENR